MRTPPALLSALAAVGLALVIDACGRSAHPSGVVVQSAAECATCHQQTYDQTNPSHTALGYPASACGGCHVTSTWLGAGHTGATEAAFPIFSGIHSSPVIACMDCHDTSISTDFKTNQNCTKTCHTKANTSGFNTPAPEAGWDWTGHHNGATFDTSNRAFCLSCHPGGQDASATAKNHHLSGGEGYNQNHQGANSCADCHTPSLSPPSGMPSNLPDFSQDIDCSTHHHPQRNGNQGN